MIKHLSIFYLAGLLLLFTWSVQVSTSRNRILILTSVKVKLSIYFYETITPLHRYYELKGVDIGFKLWEPIISLAKLSNLSLAAYYSCSSI